MTTMTKTTTVALFSLLASAAVWGQAAAQQDPGPMDVITTNGSRNADGTRNKLKVRVDPESGMMFIEGDQQDVKDFDEIYRKLILKIATEGDARKDIRVYKLRHVDVTFASTLLEAMFNEQRRATQTARRGANQRGNQRGNQRNQRGRRGAEEEREEEPRESSRPSEGFGLPFTGGEDISQALQSLEGEAAIRVVANKAQNSLIIRARTEDFPDIITLLNKIDRPADTASREYIIVNLVNISAQEAKTMVEDLLGIGQTQTTTARRTQRRTPRRGNQRGGRNTGDAEQLAQQMLEEEIQLGPEGQRFSKSEIRIATMPATNSVVVFGPSGPREQIVEIVKKLDEEGVGNKVLAIPLEKADAKSLAETLNQMFQMGVDTSGGGNAGRGGGRRGGSSSNRTVSIQADEATNTIYVVAPTHLREEIRKSIIAAEAQAGEMVVPKVIQVIHGDAEAIAEKLSEIFGGGSGSGRGRKTSGRNLLITGDKAAKRIFVTAPQEIFEQVQQLAAAMDQIDSDQMLPVHYPLSYANATDVKDRMVDMVRMLATTTQAQGDKVDMGGFAVMDDPRTNSLIVLGSTTTHLLVQKAIGAIDIEPPDTTDRVMVTIQLANADAREVAANIQKLYPNDPRANQGVEPPVVEPNEAINAVIVKATKRQQAEIQSLIEGIDELSPPPGDRLTKVFHTGAADPAQVATAIEALAGPRNEVSEKDRITAVPERQTNSVVVTASSAQMDRIEQLVGELGTESVRRFHVIKMQGGDATEIATTIMQAYQGNQRGGRGRNNAQPTVTADATTNSVIAYATDTEMEDLRPLIGSMDAEDVNAGGAPRMIALEYQNASAMADLLTEVFTKAVEEDQRSRGRGRGNQAQTRSIPRIMADDGTNQLIVRAQEKDYQEIQKMVDELDTEEAAAQSSGIKLIPLAQGIDAVETAQMIEEVINEGEEAKRRQNKNYQPKSVSIRADVRTNALVCSGSPGLFAEVEKTVGVLETMKPTGPQSVRVIRLGRGQKASEVKQVLDQILEEQSSGSSSSGRRGSTRRSGGNRRGRR